MSSRTVKSRKMTRLRRMLRNEEGVEGDRREKLAVSCGVAHALGIALCERMGCGFQCRTVSNVFVVSESSRTGEVLSRGTGGYAPCHSLFLIRWSEPKGRNKDVRKEIPGIAADIKERLEGSVIWGEKCRMMSSKSRYRKRSMGEKRDEGNVHMRAEYEPIAVNVAMPRLWQCLQPAALLKAASFSCNHRRLFRPMILPISSRVQSLLRTVLRTREMSAEHLLCFTSSIMKWFNVLTA